MGIESEVNKMEEHISKLETELQSAKERLKKYTDDHTHPVTGHKKKILFKTTPEQRKEYNKQMYQGCCCILL